MEKAIKFAVENAVKTTLNIGSLDELIGKTKTKNY